MSTYFWFIAGTLTGLSAMLIAFPLLRAARAALDKPSRIAATVIGIAGFAAAALLLYRILGRPELLDEHAAATAAVHPGLGAAAAGAAPDSMESVAARLEARLARAGGSREDWLLLAQSYDFMGRTADAQRARERADGGSSPVAQAEPAAASSPVLPLASESVAQFERRVHARPDDVEAWRALAENYRRQHDSPKARAAFENLVRLKAMDADTWANYADVLASASGSLKQSAQAIESALRLDPAHPKALWLKASLAHEEHRYADALAVWKQLRAALPPESSDVRVVDANIAEASELAGTGTPAAGGTEVSGTVSIDSKLASRIPAAATLFIYAKAVDSPGPPLAVIRQAAGGWPVTFHLDDTLAMIPSRKLSQFERVIVEARISRSGQAVPAPGDLYVTSAVLKPSERKKLALVIDREVG